MKKRENELQVLSVALDLFLLNISLFFFAFVFFFPEFERKSSLYFGVLLANLSWLLAYIFVHKQLIYTKKGFRYRIYRLIRRVLFFLVLVSLLYLPVQQLIGPQWHFLMISGVSFLGIKILFGYVYYILVRRRHRLSDKVRNALLLGVNDTLDSLRKLIDNNPQLNYRFVGYLSDKSVGDEVRGTMSDFDEVIRELAVTSVFIAIRKASDYPARLEKDIDLLVRCNQLGVRLYYVYPTVNGHIKTANGANIPEAIAGLPPVATNGSKPIGNPGEERLNGITIMNPQKIPLDSVEHQLKKRIFDIMFSGAVIVFILSWLYPLMGLFIKLSSRGPIIFKQQRTGINQLTFDCYKFRSMRPNQEADLKQATEDDPRITRIGKFMRCTNIDELPQFINVFRGDMSVVGPRPHMLRHTDQYSVLVKDYLVRHYVKPGITGYAQVSGYRGETDELWKMEKRVEFDKEYIRHWSFEWDLQIVWKTIFSLKAFANAK